MLAPSSRPTYLKLTVNRIAIVAIAFIGLVLFFHFRTGRFRTGGVSEHPLNEHHVRKNFTLTYKGETLTYKDIVYETSGYNSDRLVRVVPRRVYYDTRLQFGRPRNIVIMLTEIHDSAIDSIVACELDGYFSQSIRMFNESTGWVRSAYPQFKHVAVIIECIGIAKEAVFNGSIAKLIYRMEEESYYSRVESLHPMFLPLVGSDPSVPTAGKGSVVVCTTMYGTPEKFDQWVEYHHYLRADRVHVQAHTSFSDTASEVYPFFKESLHNGFVRMDVWNPLLYNRSTFHNQMLKYQDCIYRHMGIFEYALLYDYDDFFNPIVPGETDIHFYFSKFFSSKATGSVCLPWHQMKCGTIATLVKDVPHGNLTSILGSSESTRRGEKKCVHRVRAPLMVSIHRPWTLISDYKRVDPRRDLAYVAHNRFDIKPC